ncbi:glycoside hydrolase family 15 protein [Haloferula sp.]|uniref:glycoside hydrolase family 15 protein n=1 Tax=Haloferula sp. TaxID=2497595 RepID=UPI003C78AEFB
MSTPNAFGEPGVPPRWTSSAKEGIGTAYQSSSTLWFTLSHGIVNEIYFPHVDSPNTRDLQFLITDGETFCHEEKRDLSHQLEYPEPGSLLYRITSTDAGGRYRLIKEIIGDPHAPVLLMNCKLEIMDEALCGKLHLYALLAPHIKGTGKDNSAWCCNLAGRKFIEAQRVDIDMSFGCLPSFKRRSVGYVGTSDGWQDLMDNFQMDWELPQAENGNIALMGEVDLTEGDEFTIGVAFGHTPQSACAHLVQSLAIPFPAQRKKYVEQWKRADTGLDPRDQTTDGGSLLRLSQCILLAHEDKIFQGSFVASLSIPWGETKDDSDRGGYHLVWTRDMVQTVTSLLACGHRETPLRALAWLACVQSEDGCLPQNSSIGGKAHWRGVQLDQVAAPILLAWRVRRADAMRGFDPWTLVSRAACYLILNGPVTSQDRWEEQSGYSPSTLAFIIGGLVCAADFAKDRNDDIAARILLDHADWLSSHLEEWTATTRGQQLEGKPRHYIRITPADPEDPIASPDADQAMIELANGGGHHPARDIVGGDFLHLVRLGIRAADDPVIVDSLAVIDHVIKRELPQGPGWRRYNFDGYGQKDDGSAYDGTGVGRCWPILTGERGHYELAAGNDPLPFIETLEKFANAGGMLPEQVWDADDLPHASMHRGGPTGAAMPLCWSHAEYLSLVHSRKNGVVFDRIEPAFQRYVKNKIGSQIEVWTLAHRLQRISPGKTLRIVTDHPAKIQWSTNDWISADYLETTDTGLGCWFADLPTSELSEGSSVSFAILLSDHWEETDFEVAIQRSESASENRSDPSS